VPEQSIGQSLWTGRVFSETQDLAASISSVHSPIIFPIELPSRLPYCVAPVHIGRRGCLIAALNFSRLVSIRLWCSTSQHIPSASVRFIPQAPSAVMILRLLRKVRRIDAEGRRGSAMGTKTKATSAEIQAVMQKRIRELGGACGQGRAPLSRPMSAIGPHAPNSEVGMIDRTPCL
jgi:hypothetical protein